MNEQFKAWQTEVQGRVQAARAIAEKSGKSLRTNFDDGKIYERLMRLGIEARRFNPVGDDEHHELARLSLMDDAARNGDYV